MRETCSSSLPVDPIVSTCFVAPRLVVVTSFISQRHRRPPPSQPFGKIPWSSPVCREKGSVVAVRRRGGGGGFVAGGECTARGSACRSAESLSLFLPPPRRHSSATGLPSSSSTPWRGPRSSRRRSRTRRGPLLLPSSARREQLRPASVHPPRRPAAPLPRRSSLEARRRQHQARGKEERGAKEEQQRWSVPAPPVSMVGAAGVGERRAGDGSACYFSAFVSMAGSGAGGSLSKSDAITPTALAGNNWICSGGRARRRER